MLRCSGVNPLILILQEAGAQAVAMAMMATLPGIDANDPRKTLACFRLYSVVLSSVGTLQVGACGSERTDGHSRSK